MKFIKLIILMLCLTFFNCSQQIKIIEANKSKFISGLPNGKSYIDYRIKIETKANTQFKSILLDNKTTPSNLYLKDLSSGFSSTNIKTEIVAGIYEFGFRVFNFNNFNKEEKIVYKYLLNGKDRELVKNIIKNNKVTNNR